MRERVWLKGRRKGLFVEGNRLTHHHVPVSKYGIDFELQVIIV